MALNGDQTSDGPFRINLIQTAVQVPTVTRKVGRCGPETKEKGVERKEKEFPPLGNETFIEYFLSCHPPTVREADGVAHHHLFKDGMHVHIRR